MLGRFAQARRLLLTASAARSCQSGGVGGSDSLSHIDAATARPRMVNVGDKSSSRRVAEAACHLTVSAGLHRLLLDSGGQLAKGSVLLTAELAGVMAAKRTSELIPLCHQLPLNSAQTSVTVHNAEPRVDVTCRVECDGRTGVEMEALTGCAVAALTVYDMCKAADKSIVVRDLRLLAKTGGKSGDYRREE
uniref:cyclic pyranopterin monophosphate synthase n=1 Tax=Macrostomum lignano TaxID=282301 RepID=A0A1I8HB41_9PLAT